MATIAGLPEADAKGDEFQSKSSFLENVKYDRKNNAMDVTFKNGSVRRYLSVFPSTFENFKQSPSHSSYFARAVKGKLTSAPVVSKNIGRQQTTALKKLTQRRVLDAGTKRIQGTVARAGL